MGNARFAATIFSTVAGIAMADPYTWTDITPSTGEVMAPSLYRDWVDITPPPPVKGMTVRDVAIHPIDGRLIVGFRHVLAEGALLASSDRGTTWNAAVGAPFDLRSVEAIFAHPGLPGQLYLHETSWLWRPGPGFGPLPRPGRTFVSEDFGRSWRLANPLQDGNITAYESDPLDPRHVLGVRGTATMCCFFEIETSDLAVVSTRDGAATWTAAPVLPGASGSERFTANGPTPSAPTRVFFGRGLAFVSNDSGATFSPFANTWTAPLLSVTQDPSRANVLYAVSEGAPFHAGQLLRSDDAGASWGPLLQFRASELLPAVTVDPVHSDEVWIWNASEGVYHSADGGKHWALVGDHAGHFAADTSVDPFTGGPLDHGYARLRLSPFERGVAYVIWKGRLYRGTRSQPLDPVIVEYTYESDRYWSTALDGEAIFMDHRMEAPANIHRTAQRWGAWTAQDKPADAVGSCRFWPRPETGLRTRVLVLQGAECEILRHTSDWILEGENEFYAVPTMNGSCRPGLVPVHRLPNMKADLNFRWAADPAIIAEMVARGWVDEGAKFCGRPLGSNE